MSSQQMTDTKLTPHGYATFRCTGCGGDEFVARERTTYDGEPHEEGSCPKCGWKPFVYVLDKFAGQYQRAKRAQSNTKGAPRARV